MLDLLFQIIIYPIYALLEVLFYFLYRQVSSNLVLTILIISFVVSLFCLPLYLNAEKLQKEEEEISSKLAGRVNSIKKNFKGDERQLLLQTYYRQNNYHPVMALRLSFSLLLQIPFFLAAYIFFHNLPELNGYAFGLVEDLSKPDGVLKIGAVSVNILPVLMTVVNLLAGFVYSKDRPLRESLQIYITSFVFLVLLYNSPAGLVFYWLFNNVFSLVKNIVLKHWSPAKLITLNFNIPEVKGRIFTIVMLSLWLLYGCLIPSDVVATSPMEFAIPSLNVTPMAILLYPLSQAFGLFMFWGHCFYFLSSGKLKTVLTFAALILLITSIGNMLVIPMPAVDLTAGMQFNVGSVNFRTISYEANGILLWVLAFLSVLAGYIYFRKRRIFNALIAVNLISIFLVSFVNYFKIINCYRMAGNTENVTANLDKKFFKFSKDKKNVLIIFVDKAISSFFPVVLEEKKELKDAFSGFIYYPNTASFAGYTIIGYMPILGGYEYTPVHLQERANLFEEEFNKSVSVLPRIFQQNNWNVTVADTPSGDQIDFIDADAYYKPYGINYVITRGNLGRYLNVDVDINTFNLMLTKRNLLYFSFLRAFPMVYRSKIYDKGNYLSSSPVEYKSSRIAENYAELRFLPQMTDFTAKNNTFTVINNALPHDQAYLELPDYTYSASVGKSAYKELTPDAQYMTMHYHVNAATLILLGKYMKFLKENGVYDNTRIIIVADHGRGIKSPYVDKNLPGFVLLYNPLLLVKDFNSKGEIRTDNSFMTNADVPLLAAEKLIENPLNPYTNNPLTLNDKKSGIYIKGDDNWRENHYLGGKDFIFENDELFFVKDDIFNKKNWTLDIPAADVLK